jgi:hypothetical protein
LFINLKAGKNFCIFSLHPSKTGMQAFWGFDHLQIMKKHI